jgi:hypothetical protein
MMPMPDAGTILLVDGCLTVAAALAVAWRVRQERATHRSPQCFPEAGECARCDRWTFDLRGCDCVLCHGDLATPTGAA